jgi:hypothetical protein
MSIIIYLFEFQLPMCYLNPEFLKFLKRDCGTIPVAEITSGKISGGSWVLLLRRQT